MTIKRFNIILSLLFSGLLFSHVHACPRLKAYCLYNDGFEAGTIEYDSYYHVAFPECKGTLSANELLTQCEQFGPDVYTVVYTKGVDYVFFKTGSIYLAHNGPWATVPILEDQYAKGPWVILNDGLFRSPEAASDYMKDSH